MKNYIIILSVCIGFISCVSNSSVVEDGNTVSLFLADVNSLLSDTNKNPIVSFTELATEMAEGSIELNKDNIATALEEVKDHYSGVIVVENHTIVKLTSLEDCQKSGSWGACMPKGEGFIKKGELNYKSDYINNIIGIPSSKKVTLYLFNDDISKKENIEKISVEETAAVDEIEAVEPESVEQEQEVSVVEIVPDKACIVNYDVSYENTCSLIMYSSGNVVYLPNDRHVTNGELKLTSQSSATSDAWVYFYNPGGDCVATAHAQPMNFAGSNIEFVVSENFSLPVHISHFKIYSWWNNSSLDYLHLYYEPQNDPDYHECGL
ncbi:MAG: hypothetical protein P8M12_01050 [Flavobacteriales bacterium]|jgi:hypothetical protein|nr:hypothetical protein [Flavobacteriales bacterium]